MLGCIGIDGCRGIFDVENGLVTFDWVDGNGFIGSTGGAEEGVKIGVDCTNKDPGPILSGISDKRGGEGECEERGRERGGPVPKKSIMLLFS